MKPFIKPYYSDYCFACMGINYFTMSFAKGYDKIEISSFKTALGTG